MKDQGFYHITKVNLYKEWSLWVSQLGKVILVTGPQSSGKTTLIFKIIDKIPNLHTINRKAISFSLIPEIDKLFFTDLLEEVRKLTNREFKDGYDLLQLKTEDIEDSDIRFQLNVLKDRQKKYWQVKNLIKRLYFYLSGHIIMK